MIPAIQPPNNFSDRLLDWFEKHGRHDLPWQYHHQDSSDIYAVWLSEIMLQQTQVATVLNYFPRFLEKFPTVQDLAWADWDQVAKLWAGLGYYARARNLHQGAKQVVDFINTHHRYPNTVAEWQTIKGVGRSTAGAITAMGVRRFGVICDGNVKRVLTRHQALDLDIAKSATDKVLWHLAESLTPKHHSGKYAQAMMDLGATLCTRSRPKCHLCPLADDCLAYSQDNPTAYPVKSKAKPKPHRHSLVIRLSHQGKNLWIKRENFEKTGGIWEGLWCLPLFTSEQKDSQPLQAGQLLKSLIQTNDLDKVQHCLTERHLIDCLNHLQIPQIAQADDIRQHIRHTLTHFHWHLYLWAIELHDNQYQAILTLLEHLQVDHHWAAMDNELAKPVAMTALLSQIKT